MIISFAIFEFEVTASVTDWFVDCTPIEIVTKSVFTLSVAEPDTNKVLLREANWVLLS